MNKLAKQIAAALLAAAPGTTMALGLGEIEVKSNLNEPLRAEIELIYSSPAEAEAAAAKLANAEDFERVGLDAGMITQPLQFSVGRNADGRYVINVTTPAPVLDPFVDFLIEVNWANGRLLREYVVLLDPPLVAPSTAAPVYVEQGTAASQPLAQPSSGQQPYSSGSSTGYSPSPGSGSVPGTYGPVQAGETLWEIASNWRPDESVSMQQMMVMLLQMNPEAFQNNNINLLKRGAVLRLPNRDDFSGLSDERAKAEVRSQNQSWQEYVRSRGGASPAVSDAGVSADIGSAPPVSAGPGESRLQLRPPSASDADQANGGTGALTEQLNSAQATLAETREELLTTEAENADLRSRVNELEQLVERLRTLNVEDSDLAQLQSALSDGADGEQQSATDVDGSLAADMDDAAATDGLVDDTLDGVADAGTDALSAAGDALSDGTDTVTDAASDALGEVTDAAGEIAGEAQDAAADAVAGAGEQAGRAIEAIKTIKPTEKTGVMGLLGKYWMYLVGALVALVGGGWLVARRGSSTPEFAPVGGDSYRDRIVDSGAVDSVTDSATEAADEVVDSGSDPIDETKLIDAIDASPDNPQTHLTLLRSYYAAGEEDKFAVAAMRMQGEIKETDPTWNEVRSMGSKLLPDNPMFSADPDSGLGEDGLGLDFDPDQGDELSLGGAEAADDSAVAADAVTDEFSLDLDADSPIGASSAAEASADDLSLDLDLDADDIDLSLDLDDAGDAAEAAVEEFSGGPEAALSATPDSLDLDLGLDEAAASANEQMDDALSDLDLDLDLSDSDIFGGDDAISTKLDLAETYMRMGDPDGARGMLDEVVSEGNDEQKARAQQLLEELNF